MKIGVDNSQPLWYNDYRIKEMRYKTMTVIIEYATISPAVLQNIVMSAVPNAFCYAKDIDEDYFEFAVCGWLPMSSCELAQVEKILAQYV